MKPTVNIVRVSPDMARTILEGNTANRAMRPSVVDHYARMMREGQWQLNGESISIAPDGSLLNGQHRLHAVIKSGVEVDMVIVTNVQHEAFSTYDKQASRTTSDALKIAGVVNYTTTASMVGIIKEVRMALISGTYAPLGKSNRMSDAEVIQFVRQHNDAVDRASSIGCKTWGALGKGAVSPAVAAAMYYLFSELNRGDADVFFARLIDGAGLVHDSPILTLRNRLLGRLQGKSKSGRGELTGWFIRAWSSYRAGSPLRLVKVVEKKYPTLKT